MGARLRFLGLGLGGGRDPDRRGAAAEALGSLLGEFAQLLFLLGGRELFLAAASAATAPFLRFAGSGCDRRAGLGENRPVFVDVDDLDPDDLAGGRRGIFDLDEPVADNGERRRRAPGAWRCRSSTSTSSPTRTGGAASSPFALGSISTLVRSGWSDGSTRTPIFASSSFSSDSSSLWYQ